MFKFLSRMYKAGKYTKEHIQTAVDLGYITQEQMDEIIAQ